MRFSMKWLFGLTAAAALVAGADVCPYLSMPGLYLGITAFALLSSLVFVSLALPMRLGGAVASFATGYVIFGWTAAVVVALFFSEVAYKASTPICDFVDWNCSEFETAQVLQCTFVNGVGIWAGFASVWLRELNASS